MHVLLLHPQVFYVHRLLSLLPFVDYGTERSWGRLTRLPWAVNREDRTTHYAASGTVVITRPLVISRPSPRTVVPRPLFVLPREAVRRQGVEIRFVPHQPSGHTLPSVKPSTQVFNEAVPDSPDHLINVINLVNKGSKFVSSPINLQDPIDRTKHTRYETSAHTHAVVICMHRRRSSLTSFSLSASVVPSSTIRPLRHFVLVPSFLPMI